MASCSWDNAWTQKQDKTKLASTFSSYMVSFPSNKSILNLDFLPAILNNKKLSGLLCTCPMFRQARVVLSAAYL